MVTGNYIQLVIRGLYNSQQWQISPTYTCLQVDGDAPPFGNFQFLQPSLAAWFTALWNGYGVIPNNGLADAFAAILPDSANIQEVRVYAKTNIMSVPEQAIIVGEITGTRGTGAEILPSYVAASAFARSLTYGRRGASMRLPVLTDFDIDRNDVTLTARNLIQTTLLDRITDAGTQAALETGLQALVAGDEVLNISELVPCAVQRVPQPGTLLPSFPYEGFANISAVTCAPWTLNVWASTQNSRKIGRGR